MRVKISVGTPILIFIIFLAFSCCERDILERNYFNHFHTGNSALKTNRILSVVSLDSNAVFIGTPAGGYLYSKGLWRSCTEENGCLTNNYITCMEKSDNKILIGTLGGGLNRLAYLPEIDGISSATTYDINLSGILSDTVTEIYVDENNNEWIGSLSGISFHDAEGWARDGWVYYNIPDSFFANYINSITEDRGDTIWVGTNDGIILIKNNTVIPLENSFFNAREINDVLIDSFDCKWVATSNGLFYKDVDNEWQENVLFKGTYTRVLYPDKNNNMWIGTSEGLKVLGNKGLIFNEKLLDLNADTVFDISHGIDSEILWVGTSNGLYEINTRDL